MGAACQVPEHGSCCEMYVVQARGWVSTTTFPGSRSAPPAARENANGLPRYLQHGEGFKKDLHRAGGPRGFRLIKCGVEFCIPWSLLREKININRRYQPFI